MGRSSEESRPEPEQEARHHRRGTANRTSPPCSSLLSSSGVGEAHKLPVSRQIAVCRIAGRNPRTFISTAGSGSRSASDGRLGHISAWLDVLASDGPPQGSDGHELPTCAVVTRSSPPPPPELVGLGPVCLRSICSRSVAFCCSLRPAGAFLLPPV